MRDRMILLFLRKGTKGIKKIKRRILRREDKGNCDRFYP